MARHFKLTSPKPADQVEREVIEACRKILGPRQFRMERIPCGLHFFPGGQAVTYGEPGTPDYVALHGAMPAFYIETKATKGVLDGVQSRKHWEIKQFWGIDTVIVNDRDSLIQFLDKHEEKHRSK